MLNKSEYCFYHIFSLSIFVKNFLCYFLFRITLSLPLYSFGALATNTRDSLRSIGTERYREISRHWREIFALSESHHGVLSGEILTAKDSLTGARSSCLTMRGDSSWSAAKLWRSFIFLLFHNRMTADYIYRGPFLGIGITDTAKNASWLITRHEERTSVGRAQFTAWLWEAEQRRRAGAGRS